MKKNVVEKIITVFLIALGLFIIYQIIKKVYGGSWNSEDIIIALLVFNLGCVFTIGLAFAKLSSDHEHLSSQFKSLAEDFKKHARK